MIVALPGRSRAGAAASEHRLSQALALRVASDDVTYVIEPDTAQTVDGGYRGLVTVTRAGNNIRIEYECEHEWASHAQAVADAAEMAQRLARVLGRRTA